jgi:serine protease Do
MTRLSHSKVNIRSLVFVLQSFLLASFTVPTLKAQTSVFDAITSEVQSVFEKTSPAVVRVAAITGVSPLAGTAFFIDDKGTLLTAYDVIRDAPKAWVEYRGEKLEATILGRDARSGVALLKIDRKNTPFLKLGNSDQVKVAAGLISIAYPYNLPLTPSFGFVTGLDVRYLNRFFATTHIRASVPVSPGQIGGPLLNSKAEVVGLLVLGIQDGKEIYCLPINSALRITDDIQRLGEVRHGWVGVGVVEGSPEMKSGGVRPVLVSHFYEETPAMKSGILKGDRVVMIDNRAVSSPADILDASFFARVGTSIPVKVLRNGKEMAYTIKVNPRPESSPLIDRKIVIDGPDTLNIPFVSPPPSPAKNEPIRVNSK